MYLDEFRETALQPQSFLIPQSVELKKKKIRTRDGNTEKSRVNLQCCIKSLWRNRFAQKKGRQNGLARKTNLKLISSDTSVRARVLALLRYFYSGNCTLQPSVSNLHIITVVTGDVNQCNSTPRLSFIIDCRYISHVKTAAMYSQKIYRNNYRKRY